MSSYLFVFGRTRELAHAELAARFPSAQRISPTSALLETSEDPKHLISQLGGTVKIAQYIGTKEQLAVQNIADCVAASRNFGLSFYDMAEEKALAGEVKEVLAGRGQAVRFIAPKHDGALSSVVVAKQQVSEVVIVRSAGGFALGKTVAVQDFESWNRRDYGRPAADPKAGMLPPKVARMAVNLAIGPRRTINPEPVTIVDPFCGMGTILAEALLSGARVIGSDLAGEAVVGAEKNLQWLGSVYPNIQKTSWSVFSSDAAHVSERLEAGTVDAVVTEPFMGTTRLGEKHSAVSPEKIRNIVKGLEKLYIGCLKDWRILLRDSGKVVIAIPEYRLGNRTYVVKKVIDSCETLGYTCVAGPIEYGRPQAVVRREFFIFQKK